jgi:hypothetical protein
VLISRQRNRRDYLAKLDTFGRAMQGDLQLASFNQAGDQAYDLILGDASQVWRH